MDLFSGKGWDNSGWIEGIHFFPGQNQNKTADYSSIQLPNVCIQAVLSLLGDTKKY